MKLTKEEGRQVVYDDHSDWECVSGPNEYGSSRWSIHVKGVFKHIPSGKHFELHWSKGATETQDERAFEYSDPEPVEVEEREVMVKQWVEVGK